MDLVVLAISFVVILIGSELFTNGIEWFGHKLELGEGAIGSVLAAVGTALPETMIPFIAIVFGAGAAGKEVGVGAILGAPFMLSSLTMFVTGAAIILLRQRRTTGETLSVDIGVLGHDMAWFAIAYVIAIGAAFLPADMEWPRRLIAVVLIGTYAYYVWGHLQAEAAEHEGLQPLRFHKLDRRAPQHPEPPRLLIVTVQVIFSLGLIIGGAWGFVRAVEDIAASLGLNGTLLALVIAPVATELPEKLNSVLWVRRGKDTLAMGNITGAMVFQSAIPTSIGLALASSSWTIVGGGVALTSAFIAFGSSAAIFIPMMIRKRLTARGLLVGGLFYLGYLSLVILTLSQTRA
jgi:cation:H+ antiporter